MTKKGRGLFRNGSLASPSKHASFPHTTMKARRMMTLGLASLGALAAYAGLKKDVREDLMKSKSADEALSKLSNHLSEDTKYGLKKLRSGFRSGEHKKAWSDMKKNAKEMAGKAEQKGREMANRE
jgi:hypothetical protein